MGMGEPLANYDNLIVSLKILNAPWGGGIGARKITISTSGLAPQIRKLAKEPMQFRLAISVARRDGRNAGTNHAGEPEVSAQGIPSTRARNISTKKAG